MNETAIIIIGRDPATGKLQLSSNGKSGVYGDPDSVPVSVSPQHCLMEFSQGRIRLINQDLNNYTYVNGQAIESKTIDRSARIELGLARYPLDWQAVDALVPPEADIRPLKAVWDGYEQENVSLQIAERRFNTLRSATGLITMVAIVLSIATGGRSLWYFALYGAAIVISLLFFIKAYRDSSKVPLRRQEQSRRFQRDYVCPHCGHFMGNQPYDILAQNHHCPYCRVKFIH